VIHLDFEKAFDKVSHCLLLVKLEHNGIRGSLFKWISALLSNRKFYVKIGSASSAMQDVVPQGSVLGPVMFLVYISDVTLQLRSSHALFADDCKIYATVAKPNEIKSGLSLAAVQTWCDVLKMKLNIEKCSVLHIRVNNPKTNYSIVATVQQQKNLEVVLKAAHYPGGNTLL
jgi:ribonuclease P/MRP protein subunit RPP40